MRLYLDSCVLIYALDGAEGLRRHTLGQLERYADADWVISDLERVECLVGPLRTADQIRLLAFRSFFSDCTVVPLHPEVMERAAELRGTTRLQTADAIHLAAAVHWGCDALLTNDRAFQLSQAPLELLRLDPGQPENTPICSHQSGAPRRRSRPALSPPRCSAPWQQEVMCLGPGPGSDHGPHPAGGSQVREAG